MKIQPIIRSLPHKQKLAEGQVRRDDEARRLQWWERRLLPNLSLFERDSTSSWWIVYRGMSAYNGFMRGTQKIEIALNPGNSKIFWRFRLLFVHVLIKYITKTFWLLSIEWKPFGKVYNILNKGMITITVINKCRTLIVPWNIWIINRTPKIM